MTPIDAAIYCGYCGSTDAEHSADLTVGQDFIGEQIAEKADLKSGQFGKIILFPRTSGALLSEYPKSVKMVGAVGDIFQIHRRIVGLVSAFVVDLVALWNGTEKSNRNDAMDKKALWYSVFRERYLSISGGVARLPQYPGSRKYLTIGGRPVAPDFTERIGLINALISGDIQPFHIGEL